MSTTSASRPTSRCKAILAGSALAASLLLGACGSKPIPPSSADPGVKASISRPEAYAPTNPTITTPTTSVRGTSNGFRHAE